MPSTSSHSRLSRVVAKRFPGITKTERRLSRAEQEVEDEHAYRRWVAAARLRRTREVMRLSHEAALVCLAEMNEEVRDAETEGRFIDKAKMKSINRVYEETHKMYETRVHEYAEQVDRKEINVRLFDSERERKLREIVIVIE